MMMTLFLFLDHAVYTASLVVSNVLTLISTAVITTIIASLITKKYCCKDRPIDSQQQQATAKTTPKLTDDIAYGPAFDESNEYY